MSLKLTSTPDETSTTWRLFSPLKKTVGVTSGVTVASLMASMVTFLSTFKVAPWNVPSSNLIVVLLGVVVSPIASMAFWIELVGAVAWVFTALRLNINSPLISNVPDVRIKFLAVKVKLLGLIESMVALKVKSPSPPSPPAVVTVTLLIAKALSRVASLKKAVPSVPVVLKLGFPVISLSAPPIVKFTGSINHVPVSPLILLVLASPNIFIYFPEVSTNPPPS